jgi:hypothetical protein
VRWQLTSHAVDRWIQRVEPHLGYVDATARLRSMLPTAERIGTTPKGQVVYAVDHPDRPVLVVKHASTQQRRRMSEGCAEAVIVTVIDGATWYGTTGQVDEEAEMIAAYEALKRIPPPTWTPAKAPTISARHVAITDVSRKTVDAIAAAGPAPRPVLGDDDWIRLIAVVETERRRVEHFHDDRDEVGETHGTLAAVCKMLAAGNVDEARATCEAWMARKSSVRMLG